MMISGLSRGSGLKMSAAIACLDDIEEIACKVLPQNALGYYRSGADGEQTLHDNRAAFRRYRIMPRVMVDVSKRSMETRLLGKAVSMPLGISPTAMQRMAHPDGECASARAAQDAGVPFIFSTIATSTIEEVAAAAPTAVKWFQLYIYKDRKVTETLVRRAEAAGFDAIVLTVDAPYFGKRRQDIRNRFCLPPHLSMANFEGLHNSAVKVETSGDNSGITLYVASQFDPSLSWRDLGWLRDLTALPIVVKGILRPQDALAAIDHGVSGIMVSNHGARQVDGVPASIDALGDVVRAVRASKAPHTEIYLDGGIRTGTDVLKALALGAKAAFVGRPVLWGLAYDGRAGVSKVLELLRSELDGAMALCGCPRLEDLQEDLLLILPKCSCC